MCRCLLEGNMTRKKNSTITESLKMVMRSIRKKIEINYFTMRCVYWLKTCKKTKRKKKLDFTNKFKDIWNFTKKGKYW